MSEPKKPILTYLYHFQENLFLAQVPFTEYISMGKNRVEVVDSVRKQMEEEIGRAHV